MNGKHDETRFHGWLASRTARSAPSGLLARSMAALDQAPPRRWGWPIARSAAFAPAVATLAALALVVALVVGFLPHRPPPVADGSPSATSTASVSPTESGTPSASATASPTATPEATVTPGATPRLTPAATPTDTPPPLGPAGTLTFRLILNALPPDTQYIAIQLASNRDSSGPYPTLVPPLQGINQDHFVLCGGETNPAPCAAAMTYEQTFSGFEPGYLNYYSFYAHTTTPGEAILIKRGQRAADGGVVEARYPVPVPTASPGGVFCGAPQGGSGALLVVGEEYLADHYLCLTGLTWSTNVGPPASGTGVVGLDGKPILTVDFSRWLFIGTDGAGSGERYVIFDPPIGVANGQALSLTVMDCPDCVDLGLAVYLELRLP